MDRRSAGNPHRTRKLEDTQDKIGRLPTFCSNFSRLMLNAFTRFSNSSSSMLASVMVVKRTQFQQLWMFCFHITHVSFFGNWISKFFGNPISKKMNSNFFNYLYNQILLSVCKISNEESWSLQMHWKLWRESISAWATRAFSWTNNPWIIHKINVSREYCR